METLLRTVLREKEALLAERGGVLYRVEPSSPVAEAVAIMNDASVGCVLVMDRTRLVGIFSERDLLRYIAEGGRDLAGTRVEELMTSRLTTVTPSVSVEKALRECTERRVRHLPVCEGNELVGLLSIGDLVRFVVQDKEGTISELMDYIHGP